MIDLTIQRGNDLIFSGEEIRPGEVDSGDRVVCDLVAWMFCTDAYGTDITSVASAAAGMNKMKKEILFYRRAYEDSSPNALWRYMLEYFVRRYTELAKEKLGTDVLDTQLAYSIRFYCMGSVGMTQEWVLKDNITSAETVVRMMFHSMPENLKAVLL